MKKHTYTSAFFFATWAERENRCIYVSPEDEKRFMDELRSAAESDVDADRILKEIEEMSDEARHDYISLLAMSADADKDDEVKQNSESEDVDDSDAWDDDADDYILGSLDDDEDRNEDGEGGGDDGDEDGEGPEGVEDADYLDSPEGVEDADYLDSPEGVEDADYLDRPEGVEDADYLDSEDRDQRGSDDGEGGGDGGKLILFGKDGSDAGDGDSADDDVIDVDFWQTEPEEVADEDFLDSEHDEEEDAEEEDEEEEAGEEEEDVTEKPKKKKGVEKKKKKERKTTPDGGLDLSDFDDDPEIARILRETRLLQVEVFRTKVKKELDALGAPAAETDVTYAQRMQARAEQYKARGEKNTARNAYVDTLTDGEKAERDERLARQRTNRRQQREAAEAQRSTETQREQRAGMWPPFRFAANTRDVVRTGNQGMRTWLNLEEKPVNYETRRRLAGTAAAVGGLGLFGAASALGTFEGIPAIASLGHATTAMWSNLLPTIFSPAGAAVAFAALPYLWATGKISTEAMKKRYEALPNSPEKTRILEQLANDGVLDNVRRGFYTHYTLGSKAIKAPFTLLGKTIGYGWRAMDGIGKGIGKILGSAGTAAKNTAIGGAGAGLGAAGAYVVLGTTNPIGLAIGAGVGAYSLYRYFKKK